VENKKTLMDILKLFVDVYGDMFGWWVLGFSILGFGGYIVYGVLRSRGYFANSSERTQAETSRILNEMKIGYIESFTKLYDLMHQFNTSLQSKLTVEQVEDIVHRQIYVYTGRITDAMSEIYTINHIADDKEGTIQRIRDEIKTIVLDEDDAFFHLPNVAGAMCSAEIKLEVMAEADIYEKLYDMMLGKPGDLYLFRRSCRSLLNNHITQRWKFR